MSRVVIWERPLFCCLRGSTAEGRTQTRPEHAGLAGNDNSVPYMLALSVTCCIIAPMTTVQPRGTSFPPGARDIRHRAWVRIRLSARRAIRVSGRDFRGWCTNTNEQRFQKETRDLWVSLDHLGIRGEDLPYTVLAQRSLSMTWGSFLSRGVVAPVASLIITTISVPALALATLNFAHHYGVDNLEQAAGFLYEQWGKVAASSAPGRDPVFAVVANMALLGIPAWVMWRTLRKGVFRKYWLTQRTCAALVRCAQAKTVTGIDRPDRLRQVDSLCRAVEWSIWRSHLWRGGMTRRSPRRGAARHHAAAVIGALHRELGGSTSSPTLLWMIWPRCSRRSVNNTQRGTLPPSFLPRLWKVSHRSRCSAMRSVNRSPLCAAPLQLWVRSWSWTISYLCSESATISRDGFSPAVPSSRPLRLSDGVVSTTSWESFPGCRRPLLSMVGLGAVRMHKCAHACCGGCCTSAIFCCRGLKARL